MPNIFDNTKNLPHYTSRKEAGIGKEEPVYQNNFLVTIIPPAGISGGDLLSAQLTTISGNLPNPGSAAVEQTFKGATGSFASGVLEQTTTDLTMNFNANLNDSNQFYVYNILEAWKKRIHDPETGRRGRKRDYVGQIIVEYFDRAGEVFRRETYYDCWLTSPLPELAGDYSSGDLINLEGLVFRSDFFKKEAV